MAQNYGGYKSKNAFSTFLLCFGGLCIGKKFGTKIAGKAGILGGTILLLIGLEIFIKSFL